jgi:isopenicillin-N N-acyltransferase like protein
MRKLRKIGKWLLYTLGVLLLLLLILFIYLYKVSTVSPPAIADHRVEQLTRTQVGNNFFYLGDNWFRKSGSGLYELYVEGNDFERGVVNGKLTKELVQRQEDHFSAQIEKMIPSNFYRHFLKYFIGWFNRHLASQVKDEYKREIYGVSLAASDKYDYIGSPYQRILNYHAAHDIGHALQSMALVGCTSFATWNGHSADSTMVVGRNFDFYVGDKFAEDKIVAFLKPSTGYGFMMITWGGFTGAVSGMNEAGLTVTINAAKTAIPAGAATPVSLVAREILQYADNIQQAIQIARSRQMFVAESFLVASAADNKAVIIEKTPDSLDIYDPKQNYIVCANHFQSKGLVNSVDNKQQLQESASAYRYKRVMDLLQATPKNTVQKTIDILRDTRGIDGADIGMGNEKAINQLIAHHSIVFEPAKRKVWVSTSPWQMGQFVCYDLSKVFALKGLKTDREIIDSSLTIAADSSMKTKAFTDFLRYRNFRQRVMDGEPVNADSLVASNPNYYNAYILAGDIAAKSSKMLAAIEFYRHALKMEIATLPEREAVDEKIKRLSEKKH